MAEQTLAAIKIVRDIVLKRFDLLEEGANRTGFIDFKTFRTTHQLISELLPGYLDFLSRMDNDNECLFLCNLLIVATRVWEAFRLDPITGNMVFNVLSDDLPDHLISSEISSNWFILQSIFEMAQKLPEKQSLAIRVISKEENIYLRLIEPVLTRLKEKIEVVRRIRNLTEIELVIFFQSQTFYIVGPGDFIPLNGVSSFDGVRLYLIDSLLDWEDITDFQLVVEHELMHNLSRFQTDDPASISPEKNPNLKIEGKMVEAGHYYNWEAHEFKEDNFRPSPFCLSKKKNQFKF
jgi:hypothetical protein